MGKTVEELEYEKSEFNKFDQAKYGLKIVRNKKGKIKELHIIHRSYPLYNKGYDNYEELNIKLMRLIKYTAVEIYYVRESWNGTGYFPICYAKLRLDYEFFNFVTNDNDVRDIVVQFFKQLKRMLKNSGEDNECFYATYYFPF